jgi:hypothetical protein
MRPEILICNPVTFLQTENLSTIHAFDGESYERWYINQEPKKRYLPSSLLFSLRALLGAKGGSPGKDFPVGLIPAPLVGGFSGAPRGLAVPLPFGHAGG